MTNQERIDALTEAKGEILDALDKAELAVRGTGEEGRAKAYWLAHIRCALDDDHEYLGGSMYTLQETIDDLEGCGKDDKEDDE